MNGLVAVRFGPLPWEEKVIQTDASLSGFGASFVAGWLAGTWENDSKICLPSELVRNWLLTPTIHASHRRNINYLELIAACLLLVVRAPLLRG